MKKSKCWQIGLLAVAMTLLPGCAIMEHGQSHQSNNLFKYLYSKESTHTDKPSIPQLALPLKVGVAFVPADGADEKRNYYSEAEQRFSETRKMELLKKVSEQFKSYPFVKSIAIIPTTYLLPNGGFENLDQLQRMYGVDVIALVSYDQAQFTGQGLLSITYWTVVGAYLVQGEKNETRTLLDAAVYDITSRTLLFRAPGVSSMKQSSTPVNLSEQLRRDSEEGFARAATNLVAGLKVELEDFRERVKAAPTEFKVTHKPGYTGAGAFGAVETSALAALGIAALWMRRNQRG